MNMLNSELYSEWDRVIKFFEESEVPDGYKVWTVKCLGMHCNECVRQEGMLKECPVCGSSVRKYDYGGPYTCGCGTLLHVCKSVITAVGFSEAIVSMFDTNDDVI